MGASNIKSESSDFYSYYGYMRREHENDLYEKTLRFAVFMVYEVRNSDALMPTSKQ